MQLSDFEKNLELAKKLAAVFRWDADKMCIEVGNSEIRFRDSPLIFSSYITICKKSNIKNKILRVKLYDIVENEEDDLFIYRKKPENTSHHPKQAPSKERLFNLSLQKNIVTNYDELVEIEKIMDEYEDLIQITILLREKTK